MTKNQAMALRVKLLALRTRLLDHAVRQVEGEPSWDWLSMVADVQLALHALEAASRSEARHRVKRHGIF